MSHQYGDERIAQWLRENEYHPRSPKHGSASCLYLLDDLIYESEPFAEAARSGEIVFQEDYTVGEGQSAWNTDLVVGPPKPDEELQLEFDGRPIVEAEPSEIWLAIDAKSVMTEHGKARRNRQRDINSFADIMHRHHPGAIAGGVLLINMADRFRSPLRDEGDITEHENIEDLVEGTVGIFRDIDRAEGEIGSNVDGVACVVVEHTNMDDGHESRLVTEEPAPQLGDITHYRDFLKIIIETLEERFLLGEPPEIVREQRKAELQDQLNENVIELAYLARLIGKDVSETDEEDIERFREVLDSAESLIDEIESL